MKTEKLNTNFILSILLHLISKYTSSFMPRIMCIAHRHTSSHLFHTCTIQKKVLSGRSPFAYVIRSIICLCSHSWCSSIRLYLAFCACAVALPADACAIPIPHSYTSLFLICIDNIRWNKMFIYIR